MSLIPARTRQALSLGRAALGIAHGDRACGGPVEASLSLTYRCNLRCNHCYYHSPLLECPSFAPVRLARLRGEAPERSEARARLARPDMPHATAKRCIGELLAMGTRRFLFSANGEVLLHPHALELFAQVKRAGAYAWAFTNGTLLDGEKADAVIDMRFDLLKITTMAGTAEGFVRAHAGSRPELFEQLERRLRYLASAKRRRRSPRPRVALVLVVTRESAPGIVDFAGFAARVGACSVTFSPFDDVGDPGLAALTPGPEQQEEILRAVASAGQLLDQRGLAHNASAFPRVFRCGLSTRALYARIPCYYGWLGLKVRPDGEVQGCCRCYDVLGDAARSGLAAIWYGERYRRFRRRAGTIHRRGGEPVPACECDSCPHYLANLRVFRALHPLRARNRYAPRSPSAASPPEPS